jgi:hypothetical protein
MFCPQEYYSEFVCFIMLQNEAQTQKTVEYSVMKKTIFGL